MTGLPNNTVVIITTCGQGNRTDPAQNVTLRSYMCIGIAKSWRDPVILNSSVLWALPKQNDYENTSVLTDPWSGWLTEDPFIFFDKGQKRWRALFHQVRRAATRDPKNAIQPNGPVDKWSGGYAESAGPDLWSGWTARSPQFGAYSKEINLVRHGSNASLVDEFESVARGAGTDPAPPFKLGRSWPAFLNESLTSWGGNAVADDDGSWHLYTSAMSAGRNHNAHASDLIPGPCGVGTWESDSLIVHAVASSPRGPFKLHDLALPSQHTNPQIVRSPDGEWLLYTLGGMNCTKCSNTSYESAPGGTGTSGRTLTYDKVAGCCSWCGYGACGGFRPRGSPPSKHCDPVTPFAPLEGKVTLSRRERPKILLDAKGVPQYLYNAADPSDIPGAANPNKGWRDRPFTIVTEILKTDDSEQDAAAGREDTTRLVFMASPPAGNDANDGLSANTAVATLSRVHLVVGGMIKAHARTDIEVRIAAATYRAQSVRWSAANTMPSRSITLRPMNDSTPMPIFDGCESPTSCDRPRGFLHLGLAANDSGTRTNLHVERLDIRNYTSGFSYEGSRDSPDRFIAGNRVRDCTFSRIGNAWNLSLNGCCGAIDGVNTINNSWTRNTFRDIIGTGAHMHVIYLASYSSNNLIAHNVIDGANGDPIRFRDASNGNRVHNNVLRRAGRDAAVQDWYCDHDQRSDCTKATAECASWGNVVSNNSVHCNYTGGRLAHVARVWPQAPDKAAGCPSPPAGTPRFVIEGNSHNTSPCAAARTSPVAAMKTNDDASYGLEVVRWRLPATGRAKSDDVDQSIIITRRPQRVAGQSTSPRRSHLPQLLGDNRPGRTVCRHETPPPVRRRHGHGAQSRRLDRIVH